MNVRNDIQPVQPLDRDIQVSQTTKRANNSSESPLPAGGDQAHLSSAASLAFQTASLSDVRTEKVQAIQVAIDKGSYGVSSAKVAHSLMDHMLGNKG
ncbi:MAG: flagellar biosynthesis anti-sigma factor FlgM [Acidobacteriaceae bacterium]